MSHTGASSESHYADMAKLKSLSASMCRDHARLLTSRIGDVQWLRRGYLRRYSPGGACIPVANYQLNTAAVLNYL